MFSQARKGETNNIGVTFNIHYFAEFGQSVYVVGDVLELGFWNPQHAFRLTWTPGHEWRGRLVLPSRYKTAVIEYKYIVAATENINSAVRWEEGSNREIDFRQFKRYSAVSLKDCWGHRKFILRLRHDILDPNKVVCVYGSVEALGCESYLPRKMDLVVKKDPVTHGRAVFWQLVFQVPTAVRIFRYRYSVYDLEHRQSLWEREPDRFCDLVTLQTNHHLKPRFQGNKKDCILFEFRKAAFRKVDVNFSADFLFNQIDDNIFMGPFPQNRKEVEFLRDSKVRAVLSLLYTEEFKYRDTLWPELKEDYRYVGIAAMNVPLPERNPQQAIERSWEAACALKEMIERHGVVSVSYTHLTLPTIYSV
eukprot:TRINITY_DN4516_c0_g2_i7.p1 TRINITY_DN4516_c0_g2~~TRINITY_DN4516_c0_g2_i7.p1  ORF type:complete len:363 (-),score=53.19 TRINITY_DN4516_c0_g2_i7:34-1122(-)